MARQRKSEQSADISEVDNTDYTGTEIHVSWGEELYQPTSYNTFRSGGNSIKVVVQPGETPREAYQRGWAILEELGEAQFEDKLAGYVKRLSKVLKTNR